MEEYPIIERKIEKISEYFDGTVDKDTALKNFYEAAIVKYPELKKPANA